MKKSLVLTAVAATAVLSAGPALAQRAEPASSKAGEGRQVQVFRADLRPVPHDPDEDAGSDVTGKARLILRGNELRTVLNGRDLSPGLPHAMHIHGELEAENECPSLDADENGDGLVDTLEGLPDYGPIDISLTTSGGTGPGFDDALALDRFPVATEDGDLHYNRRFTIPAEFAESLDELHIVVHGQDLNGNGTYDGELSTLSGPAMADVPLEAELPVACGTIEAR